MRKLTVFIASFVVVLVAGAAVAQMGSFPKASDAAGEGSVTPTETPIDEPSDLEAPAQEPAPDHDEVDDERVDETDQPAPDHDEVDDERVDETDQPAPDHDEVADEVADDAGQPAEDGEAVEELWIEVLYPHPSQEFDDKTIVFEGEATPGARVFAGKYEADVNEDGGWRIVLVLSPGWNHVTFTAVAGDGREATDWVKVFYEAPAPKEEPPKEEEPPAEEPVDWEFVAHQAYGECSENPPYDVFYGKGKPGTRITVASEFGDGVTEVNDDGEWELEVTFPDAPFNDAFLVKVTDEFGNVAKFEFVRVGEDTEDK